jgi:hypothetical protein
MNKSNDKIQAENRKQEITESQHINDAVSYTIGGKSSEKKTTNLCPYLAKLR